MGMRAYIIVGLIWISLMSLFYYYAASSNVFFNHKFSNSVNMVPFLFFFFKLYFSRMCGERAAVNPENSWPAFTHPKNMLMGHIFSLSFQTL